MPLPAFPLPPGYTIRPLEWDPENTSEARLWEQVMESSYAEPYAPGDFFRIMVMNHDYWPGRVFLMFDEHGQACATATSWRRHYLWGKGIGYLLFVGVAKPWQGRGLAKPMTLRILWDFIDKGLHTAILDTEDWRLAALKTYLGLGFTPRIVHENQFERWEKIFKALKMEPVAYSREIRPPKDAPHPPRPYPYEKAWGKKGPFESSE